VTIGGIAGQVTFAPARDSPVFVYQINRGVPPDLPPEAYDWASYCQAEKSSNSAVLVD